MAGPVELVGLAVVIAVNTFLAAVVTRFFRVQMSTTWGRAIYAAVFVPLVLFVSVLVLTGVLGLGGDVGSRQLALFLVIVIPFVLGLAIDLFWMPSPEEVEAQLPDRDDGGRTPDRNP